MGAVTRFPLRLLALCLAGAPLPLRAEMSEDLAELVLPSNTLEVGAYTYRSTYPEFGRYFGLGQDATGPLLGLDWRGGGAYQGADAQRWRIQVDHPSLETRRLGLEYGEQGVYGLRLSHESLPYLVSGGYQTPLLGAGSDRLTLPAGFGARTAAGPSALPALGNEFRAYPLGTQREQTELALQQEINDAWQLRASYRHELKQGARDRAALSGTTGGTVMILPEKVDTTTDQFNLALAYGADRRHLQIGYYGSLFRNQVSAMSYQNPFSSGQLENRLGVAPDNQFHQLKLDGGLPLGATTRLSGSLAYGRMTQNEAFLPYSTNPLAAALPVGSLDGLVVTESANLRLTSRPWRSVSLRAGFQYDSRDNRTPVNAYTRSNYEAGSNGSTSNTPYSRTRRKTFLDADYTLAPGSQLGLGLEDARVHRYCRNTATSCTEVSDSQEQTVKGEWRQQLSDQLTARLSVSEARRRVDAYTPLTGVTELAGMAKFFLADRDRTQWRASAQYQATEQLSLSLRVDENQDDYRQSVYGLKDASTLAYNLEAALAVNDDLSLYAYYQQDRIRSRVDGSYSTPTIPPGPTTQWRLNMQDVADTVGLGFRHAGLLSGLLELSADLAWMEVRTDYGMSGGTCVSSACSGNLPTDLPRVANRLTNLSFQGRYQMDNQSTLKATAAYYRRRGSDYAYDGLTATSSTRLLGTMESPVRLDGFYVGVSYLRSFR